MIPKITNLPSNQLVSRFKTSKIVTTKVGRTILEEGLKAYPTYLGYKHLGPFCGTALRGYLDILATMAKFHLKLHKTPTEKLGKMSYQECLDKKLLEDPFNLYNLGLKLIGFGKK